MHYLISMYPEVALCSMASNASATMTIDNSFRDHCKATSSPIYMQHQKSYGCCIKIS